MHHSKLPLTTWFWAAGLVATHSDRVSVRLFQGLFTISAQSAQLLISKFVTILVAYGGRPLEGLVQVDHTEFQLRAADGSVNLSLSGKVRIVVAIEMSSDRVRAAQLSDDSATLIETFVRSNVKRGELLLTKGHSSFLGLVDYRHDPRGIGKALWRTERMLALATTFLRKHHGIPREEVEYALNDPHPPKSPRPRSATYVRYTNGASPWVRSRPLTGTSSDAKIPARVLRLSAATHDIVEQQPACGRTGPAQFGPYPSAPGRLLRAATDRITLPGVGPDFIEPRPCLH
jgi:hypothetical protein